MNYIGGGVGLGLFCVGVRSDREARTHTGLVRPQGRLEGSGTETPVPVVRVACAVTASQVPLKGNWGCPQLGGSSPTSGTHCSSLGRVPRPLLAFPSNADPGVSLLGFRSWMRRTERFWADAACRDRGSRAGIPAQSRQRRFYGPTCGGMTACQMTSGQARGPNSRECRVQHARHWNSVSWGCHARGRSVQTGTTVVKARGPGPRPRFAFPSISYARIYLPIGQLQPPAKGRGQMALPED